MHIHTCTEHTCMCTYTHAGTISFNDFNYIYDFKFIFNFHSKPKFHQPLSITFTGPKANSNQEVRDHSSQACSVLCSFLTHRTTEEAESRSQSYFLNRSVPLITSQLLRTVLMVLLFTSPCLSGPHSPAFMPICSQ